MRPIYEALKERRILVRYMNYDGYGDGLRISVGSEEVVSTLFRPTAWPFVMPIRPLDIAKGVAWTGVRH